MAREVSISDKSEATPETQDLKVSTPGSPSPDAKDLNDARYTIGDLAQEFGITTRAMRFYEARGLLAPCRVGANRIYSRRDRARLILILRGKNLGFTLEDIGEYLALYDADPAQQAQTEMLLGRIEDMIIDLEKKRSDLDRTLSDLRDLQNKCFTHLRGLGGDDDSDDH